MSKFFLAFLVGLLVGCGATAPRQTTRPVGATYIVRKGDTLDIIGTKFFIPAAELASYNEITDPRKLRVGQVLRIPNVGSLSGERSLEAIMRSDGARGPRGAGSPRQVSLLQVKGYLGGLVMPVEGASYTSKFGWRWGRFHEGIDLAAEHGAPVFAAHDGRVVYASNSHSGYGRIIVIQGGDLMTVYGHNSRNRVSIGDAVARGDWIADVGQSGRASGPHLHFETRIKDNDGRFSAVDPVMFLRASQPLVGGES